MPRWFAAPVFRTRQPPSPPVYRGRERKQPEAGRPSGRPNFFVAWHRPPIRDSSPAHLARFHPARASSIVRLVRRSDRRERINAHARISVGPASPPPQPIRWVDHGQPLGATKGPSVGVIGAQRETRASAPHSTSTSANGRSPMGTAVKLEEGRSAGEGAGAARCSKITAEKTRCASCGSPGTYGKPANTPAEITGDAIYWSATSAAEMWRARTACPRGRAVPFQPERGGLRLTSAARYAGTIYGHGLVINHQ